MKINEIITPLEELADPHLQEQYDNSGLITGDREWECSGIICSLDTTEEVISEAVEKNCNLVVSHHPIIFKGLKNINGKNYVEKTVIKAIKNDIAVYAIHTNLDNISKGVNGKIAQLLGLVDCTILLPKEKTLKKLYTFCPEDQATAVRNAIFKAGAGQIGNYSECSFNSTGTGTFKAGRGSNPYVGEIGKQHEETEIRIEVIFPSFLEKKVLNALMASHPYEEIAYDIISLSNHHQAIGSGLIGELPESLDEAIFLEKLKSVFSLHVIRHSPLLNKKVKRIAICGGAGSFLISRALALNADVYISADIKYHDFFDANGKLLIADIGHFESEQFTIDLLQEFLEQKFPNFAVLKTAVKTNPVYYY